ncbi:dienelactone hydrolase family protein [uncultured Friedmanniella sp.]|uniref:dienelactone hydrolase family protein n=1 Tax=uncultured Friedmanniella sp. TaxID=335381 RepID=UPI0035CC9D34
MKLREERVRIPAVDGEIEAIVIEPVGPRRPQALLYYTDIFQLTESTLRTARQLASAGFLVCLPEIYPRELPGVALEFDDSGKQAGLAGAAHTTTAQFDADAAAALDYLQQRDDVEEIGVVGFCLGGHLAFRAAFDPRVASTVCFYPTGLHNGSLGSDQADSLARAANVGGRLMIIFGSNDPHVPADARLQIISALYAAGLEHVELHLSAAASTPSCATSALVTTPC